MPINWDDELTGKSGPAPEDQGAAPPPSAGGIDWSAELGGKPSAPHAATAATAAPAPQPTDWRHMLRYNPIEGEQVPPDAKIQGPSPTDLITSPVVDQFMAGKERVAKGLSGPASEWYTPHLPAAKWEPGQRPELGLGNVLPHNIQDVGAGALGMAGAPLAPVNKAVETGLSGLTGGVVSPEQAGEAMLGMRPGNVTTNLRQTPSGRAPPTLERYGPIPSTQEIHDAGDASYNAVRGLGIELHRKVGTDLKNDIISDLNTEGFRKNTQKPVFKALDELEHPVGANVTIDDIDSVRKVLGQLGKNPDESIRLAARTAKEVIDERLANLTPADAAVNAHFVPRLQDMMAEARGNWTAYRGARSIEDTAETAETKAELPLIKTYGSQDRTIRAEFNRLARDQAATRYMTDEERELLGHVTRGSDLLRYAGEIAPTGALSTLLHVPAHLLTAMMTGGTSLMAQAMAPGIGWLIQRLGLAYTRGNIKRLSEKIRESAPYSRAGMTTVWPKAPGAAGYGAAASPWVSPDNEQGP